MTTSPKTGLFRASLTTAGGTLASRFLGLLRDILFAALLGASQQADAFIAAFRLPNLFRRLFAEGAFSAAFIPLYAAEEKNAGEDSARRFAGRLLALNLLFMGLITLLAEIFMPYLLSLLAGGFASDPEKFAQTVLFARIAFPYLISMVVVALYAAILNAAGRFLAAALAPCILNLALISALLFAASLGMPGLWLSWGACLSGLAQVALLALACHRAHIHPRLGLPRLDPALKRFLRLSLPALAAASAGQINLVVATRIASIQESAVSFLYYAERLYQLPLAVIALAAGTALLPALARRWQEGDEAQDALNRTLEAVMFLTIPAAAALCVMPQTLISAFFEYGAFSNSDTRAAALALTAFALGLPAFAAIRIFSPAFFARQDMRWPLFAALAGILLNALAAFFLFFQVGHWGVALAASLAGWLNALLLLLRLKALGSFAPDSRLLKRLAAMTAAALLMAAALIFAQSAALDAFGPTGEWNPSARLAFLAALVAGGLALYLLLCQILRAASLKEINAALRQS